VLLLEKGKKPGVKVLMSGGTRCNVTHDCDERAIVAAFGPNGRFLHSALANFGVRDTIDFFEGEGVATKVEATGKVFPVSNRAVDVLDALLRRLHRSGATLALGEAVLDLRAKPEGGFEVFTEQRTLAAPRVVLTTGGKSYPGCGTRGDGYAWAERFGHTIVAPVPALVPITVAVEWVGGLRGITLDDAAVKVREGDRILTSKRGGFLFAHFGLSGPAPLDASNAITRHPDPKTLQLEIDLLPSVPESEFDRFLQSESLASGKKQLAVVLATHVPRRLADALLTLAGLPADRRAAGLSKADRGRLVGLVKRLRLPVRGTLGFEKAEVTAGGVALDEVESKTMRSKKVPDLFLAGEILDLDGPIGGYNFQAAWSTGWLAGQRAAQIG
jgi:predicted Rossmann fold flavoprotein